MENPKFQIFRSPSSFEYYYRLKSVNGQIILSGEGYKSKQVCENGIQSVKSNAHFDHRFENRTASNGQYYFVLKAGNNEIIGVSETYTSTYARENGKQAVKRDAPRAPIEDLT